MAEESVEPGKTEGLKSINISTDTNDTLKEAIELEIEEDRDYLPIKFSLAGDELTDSDGEHIICKS